MEFQGQYTALLLLYPVPRIPVLQILKLPERVLAALRTHAGHPRIRAHFTEKHLRQLVRENPGEAVILREIDQVVQSRA